MPTKFIRTFSIDRKGMVHNNTDEDELLCSTISDDNHIPLSETVATLASEVYKELERIIKSFGENSVKDLMPVMISTLGIDKCSFLFLMNLPYFFFLS